MTAKQTGLAERAAELRRAFDRTFAEAPRAQVAATEAFLAIGVGGDPYALRLAEISGLFADKKLVPLPSTVPELLGIAGFRGALVPVYDLRALLGYPAGPAPRWLVLVSPDALVGLAFDRFDGHLHVPRDAVAQERRPEIARAHVREVVRIGDAVRSIVQLPSVLETIKNRARPTAPQKE